MMSEVDILLDFMDIATLEIFAANENKDRAAEAKWNKVFSTVLLEIRPHLEWTSTR